MPPIATDQIDVIAIRSNLHVVLQASARMYMHFARETLLNFGDDGQRTVRDHLRKYGQWRAYEMREAHNAMDRPINMETLNRCWDSASVFVVKDDIDNEGYYSATDVAYDVRYCPAAEAWKADDFHRWGHVYCDEFHQSCASSYHPDGNVVIPINMMKGDDHCHFRWVMPATATEVESWPPTTLGLKLARYYQAETPERAAYDAMVRTSRLMGGRYWTMVSALYSHHDAQSADDVIRQFLRSWGRQRGQLMRIRHLEKGVPLLPEYFVRDMDLSPHIVWEMHQEQGLKDSQQMFIDFTPMDDAWTDLECAHAAKMFWEESLPAMVGAYSEDMSVDLTELVWRGDARTTVTMATRS